MFSSKNIPQASMKDLTFTFYFVMVRYNNTIALLGSGCYVCASCLLTDEVDSSVILLFN